MRHSLHFSRAWTPGRVRPPRLRPSSARIPGSTAFDWTKLSEASPSAEGGLRRNILDLEQRLLRSLLEAKDELDVREAVIVAGCIRDDEAAGFCARWRTAGPVDGDEGNGGLVDLENGRWAIAEGQPAQASRLR
jgi:hypothetical protein